MIVPSAKSPLEPSSPLASSSHLPEDDPLPVYTPPSAPFPESVDSLNPEAVKKLSRTMMEEGRQLQEYGFEPPVLVGGGTSRAAEELMGLHNRKEYAIDSRGNIVSHDPTLSTSPLALSQFLTLHSSAPPTLTLHLRGSHSETRSTTTFVPGPNGTQIRKTTTRTEEVEDFNFALDLGEEVEKGLGRARGGGGTRGLVYSVGNWEAVKRGGRWRTVGEEAGRVGVRLDEEEEGEKRAGRWRVPGLREGWRLDREREERRKKGWPGFVHPESLVERVHGPSQLQSHPQHPPVIHQTHYIDLVESHAVAPFALLGLPAREAKLIEEREARAEEIREVLEAYCFSKRTFKELKVTKEVYGWDFVEVERLIRATIAQTHYEGTVSVRFETTPTTIIIRPANDLSRVFSLPVWIKLLLWLTLVYPLLLLISLLLGDKYHNLRVAFPLLRYRSLHVPPDTPRDEALKVARQLTPCSSQRILTRFSGGESVQGEEWFYLCGRESREWVEEWGEAIKRGVREGKRGML